MVVRKLIESDPPHRAGRAMPHKQALRVAHKYLTGKRGQPDGTKPRLLILLGGSGAGKSTMISNLSKASDGYVDPKHPEWVMSGLDEFIEFVPEYIYAVRDVTVGYSNAATYAYSNAIKIAVATNMECMKRRLHMIFEDTGKELSRTVRVINDFGKNRIVTVALVDNTPDVAISRAAGRFQITGRYSSADYIRSTFSNVFEHYLQLKKMYAEGQFSGVEIDSFIYCNNNAEKPLMYMDGGPWKSPLVSKEAFTKGPVEYRPHISVLEKMLLEQTDVQEMYNKFVTKVSGGTSQGCEEEEKKGE